MAGAEATAGWMAARMRRIVAHADVAAGTVSIAVVDDGAMAALHEAHMGVAGPTDVLTFDLRDPTDSDAPVDVDVAVNLDEATRRARERGHDAALELLLYAVHGLLHVTGHDDHDPAAAARMHQREDALLVAIGLPPVYGGDVRPSTSSHVGNAS